MQDIEEVEFSETKTATGEKPKGNFFDDDFDSDLAKKIAAEVDHLNQPVQKTNAIDDKAAPAAATPTPEEAPAPPPPPPTSADNTQKLRRKAIRFAKTNDMFMSGILAMQKNLDRAKLKADNEELMDLIDSWESYLMENEDFDFPPIVQVLIANASIYLFKAFGGDIMKLAGNYIPGLSPTAAAPAPHHHHHTPPPPPPPPNYGAAEPVHTIVRTEAPAHTHHTPAPVAVAKAEHTCALPGCGVELKKKKAKFCSGSHRTMWQNHIRRGIPIDPKKI